MTEHELKRLLPNASGSFIKRNAEDHSSTLPADNSQPVEGSPLQRLPKRKKASSHGPVERIGLGFCIWAVRPADPDGWDFKEIIDALVGAKILDGDEWDRFYIAEIRSEKVHSKTQERTEISIIYPTKMMLTSNMTRAQLIEALWSQCGSSWNRSAFDAFVETLTEEDLRRYVVVGTT